MRWLLAAVVAFSVVALAPDAHAKRERNHRRDKAAVLDLRDGEGGMDAKQIGQVGKVGQVGQVGQCAPSVCQADVKQVGQFEKGHK